MGIQALLAQGAQSPLLCRRLLEDPQEIANSHHCKGTLYRVASIISALAMVAIFTSSMAVYLGLMAMPPTFIVAIGLISAFVCMQGLSLWHSGTTQFVKANEYQLVADKLNTDDADGGVRDWDAQKIGAFFREQNLLPHLFTPEALEAIPKDHQLFKLLPLIAYYKVLTEQAEKIKRAFDENIRCAEEFDGPNQEELEMRHRFTAMNKAEELAFIQLNRAVILENLKFPEQEYGFGVVELQEELEDGTEEIILANGLKIDGQSQGVLNKKQIQMRALDYIVGRDRVFFVNRLNDPITLEDFRESEPKDMRARLFDPPAPAPDFNAQNLV